MSKPVTRRELLGGTREPLPTDRGARRPGTLHFEGWLQRVLWAFRALAASPARLFGVMFALNALSNAYAGVVHDAIVYSLQALNAATRGAYGSDLFLKYGSQDRFTVFSPLVAPLVRLIDVRPAFFLLFLASTALWLWAASRLIRHMFDDAAVAVAASIFVAVAPMWYGGIDVFRVAEPFFTPRLPACALAMLGISWVLRDKIWRALAILAGAALLHPIMALPALLVWSGYIVLNRFTPAQRVLVCVVVAAATAFVMANGSIAGHALPQMDDAWRNIVHWTPLNFPLDWTFADWLRIVDSVLIVTAGAWLSRNRDRVAAQVLALVALAGVGGVAIAVFASQSSNALLFQAQAYRALWLVSFFEGPVAVWLLLQIYRSRSRLAWFVGSLLIAYLGRRQPFEIQIALTGAVFIVSFIVRCVRTRENAVDAAARALALSAFIAATVAPIVPPLTVLVVDGQLVGREDAAIITEAIFGTFAPFGFWIFAATVFAFLHRRGQIRHVVPAGLIAVALVVQSMAFAVPLSSWYKSRFKEDTTDLSFAQNYLSAHSKGRPVSVYADFTYAAVVWVEWHAISYFQTAQTVGVIFNRENALETQRRARMLRPFEAARWAERYPLMPDSQKVLIDHLYDMNEPAPEPSMADLHRLCADPELDVAMLTARPSLLTPPATNGRVNIYDCHQFRNLSARRDRESIRKELSHVE